MKSVIIVGGGTAGWMTAAALSKAFPETLRIELIESAEIGTVGVGEATIPPITNFHSLLDLAESDFLRAVNGTFKLGIEFTNWGNLGESYFHPFSAHGVETWAAQFHHYWRRAVDRGETAALDAFSIEASMARANRYGTSGTRKPGYAYHLDATRYAGLLRGISEEAGVVRIEGKVVDVALEAESGFIENVTLESGDTIAGDFFIDCTGFRALLIEGALETGWEDWSDWLRNDRAVAVQTESVAPPAPYTRATARRSGWQWNIPLQNRVGNGLVFSSAYMSEEAATKVLVDNLTGNPITEPRTLRFKTGRRLRQWNRNCLAIGLSSGFLEPLESTSIHLIQNSIIRFVKLFPAGEIEPSEVDQYNREVKNEIEHIRDFIIAHYHVTQRRDSDYWEDCRNMPIPDSLLHKLTLFEAGGKVFRDDNELFSETSWIAVLVGQGLLPKKYHPVVDNLSDAELKQMMRNVRQMVHTHIAQQPSHQSYLHERLRTSR